jgi:zona occludens toxin
VITLITGAPGAGKSSYIVAELLEFVRRHPERPVFVGGIPGLCVSHEVLPDAAEWVEPSDTANGWRWRFPDGALLILDEAQSVFRPRATGKAVPPHVAALEVHRHQGLDIWLATQAPGLIDANVRRLVGRYIHLRSTWAGRKLLEWSECVDPSSRSERTASVQRGWKLPKGVFGQYQSASLHTVQKRRLPRQVWIVAVLLAFLVSGGWYMYGRIYGGGYIPEPPAGLAVNGASPGSGVAPYGSGGALKPEDFIPRVRGRPESAPLYDQVRQVHQMPIVVGCVATADRCTCFTQQGTDAFLDSEACRAWISHRPFQPFVPAAVSHSPASHEPGGAGQAERSDAGQRRRAPLTVIADSDRLAAGRSVVDTPDIASRRINRGPHHSSRTY